MDTELIPWIYAAIMTVGLIYLLFSIFFGGLADIDADVDVDFDLDPSGFDVGDIADAVNLDGGDAAEARGLGCMVISAFLVGFGSVGLMASLSGWTLLFSLLVAFAFGMIFGRTSLAALRFVLRQEGGPVMNSKSLIGEFARITVNIPAGHTGEAIVEGESILKYPVRAVADDVVLNKGDYVEIIDVENGRLFVKKKRDENN